VLEKALVGEAVQAHVLHLDAMHGDQGTVGTDQAAEGDGCAGGLVDLAFEAGLDVLHLHSELSAFAGQRSAGGRELMSIAHPRLAVSVYG
jgi:hypothetical protein